MTSLLPKMLNVPVVVRQSRATFTICTAFLLEREKCVSNFDLFRPAQIRKSSRWVCRYEARWHDNGVSVESMHDRFYLPDVVLTLKFLEATEYFGLLQ